MTTTRKPRTRKPATPDQLKARRDRRAAKVAAEGTKAHPVTGPEVTEIPEVEVPEPEVTEAEASQDPDAEVWEAIGDPEGPAGEPDVTGWDEAAAAAQADAETHPAEPEVTEDGSLTRALDNLRPHTVPAAAPGPEALAYFTVAVPTLLATAFTEEMDNVDNWPGATVTAVATPKAKGRRGGSTGTRVPKASFPEGTLAPIAFHHLMVTEGTFPETLRAMRIYEWINGAARNGFPVSYVSADGTVHTAPQPGPDGKPATRPAVRTDEARAWYQARYPGKVAVVS